MLTVVIHVSAMAQSPAEQKLKAKYEMVQYHKECGGWYLIGYTQHGQQMYGFADNHGNVIASEATNYKIYPGHIELYLLNLQQKAKHDQWKADYKEYEQKYNEYQRVEAKYKADLAAYKTKYDAAYKEATALWKRARQAAMEKAEYEAKRAQAQSGGSIIGAVLTGVVGGISISAAAESVEFEPFLDKVLADRNLLVAPQKPYNPLPTKPTEPANGFYWGTYPLRQPCKYSSIDYSQIKEPNGVADVCYNNKWGLVDSYLNEIVPCTNSSKVRIEDYKIGYFLVKVNNCYGVIASDGKYIIPAKYHSITKSGTRFLVKNKEDKFGLLNLMGKTIIPCKYESMVETEGYWACKENDLWGIFTDDNVEFYPCQFQDVALFKAGNQLILKNKIKGLWGAIDFLSGKELFPNNYESIQYQTLTNYPDTFYIVCRDSKYGLYTNKGVLIIPCEYNEFKFYTIEDRLTIGGVSDSSADLFETSGLPIFEPKKYNSWQSYYGHFIVRSNTNQLYGVLDKYGNMIVPCKYESIKNTSDIAGFKATIGKKVGYVTFDGQELFPFIEAEDIKIAKNKKVFIIKQNGYKSYGVVDFNGRVVVPCKNKSDKIEKKIESAIKRDTMINSNYETNSKIITNSYTNKVYKEYTTKADRGKFSFYAQNYVERIVEEWQIKGEFEKVDDWKKRVNDNTLKQKIHALTKEAQEQYIANYEMTKPTDNPTIVGAYDPDNETYRIKTVYSNEDILVHVDTKDAIEFKTLFSQVTKKPIFFVENDQIGLAEYHFTLPNGNKYSYSNQASLTHSVAHVKYNLSTIEIDSSSSNKGFKRGKQTISTSNFNFGTSDVDTNIPISEFKRENTFAVIFANENYENAGETVQYAYNDGQVFKDYCEKALGIPKENIHFRADATLANMKFELNWLKITAKAHEDVQIIVYYAGHGMPNPNTNDAYLLPVDGYSSDYTTAIKLSELYEQLNSIPTKNTLVFLDACFSGTTRSNSDNMLTNVRGVRTAPKMSNPKGNMVVFSATSNTQTAHPYHEQSHGLFTYFMLKWLRDNYQNVVLGNWYDYINKEVSRTASKNTNILQEQYPSALPSSSIKATWRDITF